MRFRVKALLLVASLVPASLVAGVDRAPDGERWWSHVLFLADDRLEGRDTGSEGHRKSAEYVAREFAAIGLKPAGTDEYFQPVRLKTKEIDESHFKPHCWLVQDGNTEALTLGEDANITLRVDPAPSIDAELVFTGYGLAVPEADYDDFKGLDIRGKVVVYLAGAPPSIPGPLAAHMQSAAERRRAAESAGGNRHRRDPEPQEYGHPLGAIDAGAVLEVDDAGRSGA